MNVLHLLNLERQRFWPNTTFRTIIGLYFGAFAVVLFLAYKVGAGLTFNSNGTEFNPAADLFTYPRNWELVAWIGSWMNVTLLGFLGVFMTTLEFSNKTLRQSIIFGMTRLEVATAKVASAIFLALCATVFYVQLGWAGGLLGGIGITLPPPVPVLFFFLQALGYLLLGIVTALLIRQTALATLAYLAYVMFVEFVGRWVFYFVVAKTRNLLFLPDHVLEQLTPLPLPESVRGVVESNQAILPLNSTETGLAALVYLGVFALLLYRKIGRADL
jgi:ABC-2 type transport system permease protein